MNGFFARLLLYLLLTMIAAGCLPPGTPSPTQTVGVEETAASPVPTRPSPTTTPELRPRTIQLEPEALAGRTVRFWHVWDGVRGALIDEFISEFNTSNPYDVQVNAHRAEDIAFEIDSALLENTPPDLAVGFNYHAAAWAAQEAITDLLPYAVDPLWGYSIPELDDFVLPFWVQAAAGQRQFGLPFYRTAEVLLYNQTWAQELGFADAPATPQDLETQACAANTAMRTDNDVRNDAQGGMVLAFEPGAITAWMYAFGGSIEPIREDEVYSFDRAENVAAFSFLRRLLNERCAWVPEAIYAHTEFAGRLALFVPTTLAGLSAQADAMAAVGNTDQWLILPYPSLTGSTGALFSGPDIVIFQSTPEQQLAAWVFAKWLAAPEIQARWAAATGYYPVRTTALHSLAPTQATEADWIPNGAAFPGIPSWSGVQWVVSDFARVLYAPFTTLEEVPALAVELDTLSEEIADLAFP